MKSAIVFAVCILLCGTAFSDIDVKPQYDEHEPIVATVTITNVPDGAKLRGSFAVSDGSYLAAGENVYHVWAPPGTHVATAQGVWVLTKDVTVEGQTFPVLLDFGQFSYAREFTVGEVPVPVPPIPPVPPIHGPWQIVMFYDQDQLDNLPAEQRALLTSLAYRQKLEAAGHLVLGVFAIQSVHINSKFAAYLDAVKGDPMPRVALASLQGGQVVDAPLPASFADLETLLAEGVKP